MTTARAVASTSLRRFGPNDENGVRVTYEYEVAGKAYRKKVLWKDHALYVDYPREIEIYYRAEAPGRACTGPELAYETQKGTGCLTSVIVPILVILAVYNLLRLV